MDRKAIATDLQANATGMKLVILGATGATGLEVVRQTIDHGHSVTAFVRSPGRLDNFKDRITVKTGNLLDGSQLVPVLQGHDAVISAFGPRVPISAADAHLLEQFARTLTRAMQESGVARIVIESVAFLFRDSIIPPGYLLGKLFFRTLVADSAAMERIIESSQLDWTIVRPPQLTNNPSRGNYRMREGHLPIFGFKISRADVADFMIAAVERRSSVRKVVGVSN